MSKESPLHQPNSDNARQNGYEALNNSEKKEQAEKELQTTRRLCAEYHEQLDQTKYFDSAAIEKANKLLPSFNAIRKDLLTESVNLVVKHRIAYLFVMASFKSRPAIGEFFDSVKEHVGDISLLLQKPRNLYEMVKNSDKFKALSAEDLSLIILSLNVGITSLAQINNKSKTNWDDEADSLLRPKGTRDTDVRIDDKIAAGNLMTGYEKMREFATYAQVQKLQKAEN